MNNDLTIQFARLWGQLEASSLPSDEPIADILKSYDSDEIYKILSVWVSEYLSQSEYDDTVEFFERKIEELRSNNYAD